MEPASPPQILFEGIKPTLSIATEKKFNTPEDLKNIPALAPYLPGAEEAKGQHSLDKVEAVKLSGNSYSIAATKTIAEHFISKLTSLEVYSLFTPERRFRRYFHRKIEG